MALLCLAVRTVGKQNQLHPRPLGKRNNGNAYPLSCSSDFVIVDMGNCHAVTIDTDAVHLCRCRVVTLPFTASNTFITSSFRETKKALDIFKEKTASAC
jgi:hypothetical protein